MFNRGGLPVSEFCGGGAFSVGENRIEFDTSVIMLICRNVSVEVSSGSCKTASLLDVELQLCASLLYSYSYTCSVRNFRRRRIKPRMSCYV